MEERQLTARGPTSRSRAEAWVAWEAAIVEFNTLFAQKREEKKKLTKVELAVLRRKFDLVALEVLPNRGTVKAVPLGGTIPVEVSIGGTNLKWSAFEITAKYPQLRAAQLELFAATGVPPTAAELGLVKPRVTGPDRATVTTVYREFLVVTGLPESAVCLEGTAALVAAGVVPAARPGHTDIAISVCRYPTDPVVDWDKISLPKGVVVTHPVDRWLTWSCTRVQGRETAYRHPQVLLSQMEQERSVGYQQAIRTWMGFR